MFCATCGKQLPDDAKFCDGCGTAIGTAAPAAPEAAPVVAAPVAPVATTFAAPKKSNKKVPIIIGAVAAAVAVIVALVLILFTGSKPGAKSPEKAAENLVTAYCKRDAKALVNCWPDFFVEEEYDSKKEAIEELAEEFKDAERFTYKILSVTRETDKSDALEWLEDLAYEYDSAVLSKIKDCCTVNVDVRVDGDLEELEVFCIKYSNRWYALDFD